MLRADSSCLYQMGAVGKMLLTELGCHEFTGSVLMQRVLNGMQVGIPLSALSKNPSLIELLCQSRGLSSLSAAVAH